MKKIYISTLASIVLVSSGFVTDLNAEILTGPHVYIESTNYFNALNYDNTDYGNGFEWQAIAYTTGSYSYIIYDDVDDANHDYTKVFELSHSLNNENSFIVDTSGDINLADGSVWIDRSLNAMGIGTTAPEKNLHIVDTTTTTGGTFPFNYTKGEASIKLDAYDNSSWALGSHYYKNSIALSPSKSFKITDTNNSATPFVIYQGSASNTLVLNTQSNVGIGTSAPGAKLDVAGDMKATFSGAGTESVYKLLTLTANDTDGTGPSEAAFVLRNNKADKEWLFRTIDDGTAFTATLGGTGGAEFKIVSDQGDYTKTKLYIGGVLVFANGKIQAGVLP